MLAQWVGQSRVHLQLLVDELKADLPASCVGARTDEDSAAQRPAIRDAARTELNILRRE